MMRCEECLPFIEEYFDGELDEQNSKRVSAHMSACAACTEAFDALLGEQEIYANYERCVEVTPALWQAVRARIEERTDAAPLLLPPPSLLMRLRERVAHAFGALSFTPALATSFALVATAAVAGMLWVARSDDSPSSNLVAWQPVFDGRSDTFSLLPDIRPSIQIPFDDKTGGADAGVILKAGGLRQRAPQDGDTVARLGVNPSNPSLNYSRKALPRGSVIPNDHQMAGDDPLLSERLQGANRVGDEAAFRPLADVEETEVARHIERAQLLLRSFKNMSLEEGQPTGDVAYEKQLSKELLSENMMLRRDAETVGNVPTERLLSTLEPYLLDIANLQDRPSTEDVRSITERMKKHEIIAALQVY